MPLRIDAPSGYKCIEFYLEFVLRCQCIFFSLFNIFVLFSKKAVRLTRRGEVTIFLTILTRRFTGMRNPVISLRVSPGFITTAFLFEAGVLSQWFLVPENDIFVAFKATFLLCNNHLPHL